MKFWRNTSVAALAVALSASTAFAALAPKAPAAATGAISCTKNTNLTEVEGLVMCVEMQDDTQNSFGNGFPWENSAFFFASYRNQYLYPSSTVNAVKNISTTMKSVQSRANSFAAASTVVYDNGFFRVTDAIGNTLQNTFALNTGGTTYCSLTINPTAPVAITTASGSRGSLLSTCLSCPMVDMWCQVGPTAAAFALVNNIMFDQNVELGTGNAGNTAWDVTHTAFGQGCAGPQRAFGSGSFVNPNWLTTAYGVDEAAFVWVFKGTAPPPPATVEQQIKEIVRLLLTPEGLRCSGLDLNPGNDRIEDDPISFPNGSKVDPIQPQISTGGTITGDELIDDLRNCGWRCN